MSKSHPVARFNRGLIMLAAGLALLACAPTTQTRPEPDRAALPAVSAPQKSLVIAIRGELPSVAARPLNPFSGALYPPLYLFNAALNYRDELEVPRPYLAALPELNTDTWRVFPDGRMETTYPLRPSLTWHDGMPLTARDFVFAWRVYGTPQLGAATSPPVGLMDEVLAPDDRTGVIRWRRPYPDAAVMANGWVVGFQALPQHILQEPFRDLDPVDVVRAARRLVYRGRWARFQRRR